MCAVCAPCNVYVLLFVFLICLYIERSCDVGEALVSGPNPIPDAYMTASSEYNDFHGPRHARINSTSGIGGWLCHTNESTAPEPRMYLQVCVPYTNTITLFIK